ncbi:MAG: hypothetical protein CVU59_10575 [Deltaproteobacteria bacterium HGW-Deltaproteobacteria-17]|nr:MAG: hypothetical protein CVU59_10575 [Deltaproteobacteria bacterium HGW-Deltaproteobacteria-17]
MNQPRTLKATLVGWPLLLLIGLAVLPRTSHAATMDPPEPFLFLAWDTDVGRILGDEADSSGPKSFAVKGDGGLLILDQVNLRVLDFDPAGRELPAYPLPGPAFDDVGEAGGRYVLALDRLVTRTLLVFDLDGSIVTELDLVGHGIEHAGLITAMFARTDGVWLEVSHRHSVRVLDAAMRPCERRIVLGRPIEGGRSLIGRLDRPAGGATISIGPRNAAKPDATITIPGELPIRRIVQLDADAKGRVLVVLHEALFAGTPPFGMLDERYRLIRLDDGLAGLWTARSPWVLTELDQRQEVRLGPDGGVWQMFFTWEGVFIARLDGRTP